MYLQRSSWIHCWSVDVHCFDGRFKKVPLAILLSIITYRPIKHLLAHFVCIWRTLSVLDHDWKVVLWPFSTGAYPVSYSIIKTKLRSSRLGWKVICRGNGESIPLSISDQRLYTSIRYSLGSVGVLLWSELVMQQYIFNVFLTIQDAYSNYIILSTELLCSV